MTVLMVHDTLTGEQDKQLSDLPMTSLVNDILLEVMNGEKDCCEGYSVLSDVSYGNGRTIILKTDVYSKTQLVITLY